MTEIKKIDSENSLNDPKKNFKIQRVRDLLSLLCSKRGSVRYGLVLLTPENNRFVLSIQASSYHYCYPRVESSSLNDYEYVEVGIISIDGEGPFKYGGSYSFDFDSEVSKFTLYEDDKGGGWLRPSHIGFKRFAKEHEDTHDDVFSVKLEDLILDLKDFFDDGGVIDGTHEFTQDWLRKVAGSTKPINAILKLNA